MTDNQLDVRSGVPVPLASMWSFSQHTLSGWRGEGGEYHVAPVRHTSRDAVGASADGHIFGCACVWDDRK